MAAKNLARDLYRRTTGTHPTHTSPTMATTSKQHKAIGEDLWKGRTEKTVRQCPTVPPTP